MPSLDANTEMSVFTRNPQDPMLNAALSKHRVTTKVWILYRFISIFGESYGKPDCNVKAWAAVTVKSAKPLTVF